MSRTSKVIYGEDYILSCDKRAKLAIYHDQHSHRWVCVLSFGTYEPYRSTLKTKEYVGFIGDLDVDLIQEWQSEGVLDFEAVVVEYDNSLAQVYYDGMDERYECLDFNSTDVTNMLYAQIEKLAKK